MKKNYKKIVLLFITVVIFSAFISCNEKSDKTENADKSGGRIEFEAVTDIIDGRKNIYAVLKVISGDYWQGIVNGLKDAGNDNDCNVYIGGGATEADWDAQDELLNEACGKGADAIIFAPTNSSKFENTANKIHAEGIPLILVDTILTSGYYDVCYMTDNFQAGQLAAEELLSMLKEKGYKDNETVQVGIQVTSKDSQTLVDRVAGFNKYWFKNAPDSWTIVDEIKFNQGDLDIAIQNGNDFLSQYPELKAAVSCNNSSSVGFATAVKESGRKDIIISAFDYSEIIAEMIKDKDYTVATVVQKQYDMGYNGIVSALDLINGKSVDYKFVDTGVLVINERNYQEYEKGK